MVKIEVLIQPFKLDDVKAALEGLGVEPLIISHVLEHDGLHGPKTWYRGAEYSIDVPMVKLEVLISSLRAEEVIDVLLQAARTNTNRNDGTILISEIADAISVRSGQHLQYTIA